MIKQLFILNFTCLLSILVFERVLCFLRAYAKEYTEREHTRFFRQSLEHTRHHDSDRLLYTSLMHDMSTHWVKGASAAVTDTYNVEAIYPGDKYSNINFYKGNSNDVMKWWLKVTNL